jgi:hypothetical protein
MKKFIEKCFPGLAIRYRSWRDKRMFASQVMRPTCLGFDFIGVPGMPESRTASGEVAMLRELLHGKVVDMLYFPMMSGTFPTWFPLWGGESFEFFRPVFNLADFSISFGVITILVFQNKLLHNQHIHPPVSEPVTEAPMSTDIAEEDTAASIQP